MDTPRSHTVVQLYGEYESDHCGYCNAGKSISFGLKSTSMLNEEYEALMVRGFRRCGDFFYKPVMHKTCCPMYTIRLNAASFKPSKSQRYCLRKFENSLAKGEAFVTSGPTEGETRPANILTVETVPAVCTHEIYELYKAYQISVHGDKPDEITVEKFKDFLVVSALPVEPASGSRHARGTHHQLYRIDGKLVAVGVLDFLPNYISSVYCFYDPTLKHLALGKFAALKEIQYCVDESVPFYCLGFYIHSCPKMKYKGEYSPSELLCPMTMNFFPLESVAGLLEAHKFTPLDQTFVRLRERVGDSLYRPILEEDATREQQEAKERHDREMAALFRPRPAGGGAINVDVVPLSISGARTDLRLSQLRLNYQEMLKPLLTEWVVYAGEEVASRIKVKF